MRNSENTNEDRNKRLRRSTIPCLMSLWKQPRRQRRQKMKQTNKKAQHSEADKQVQRDGSSKSEEGNKGQIVCATKRLPAQELNQRAWMSKCEEAFILNLGL